MKGRRNHISLLSEIKKKKNAVSEQQQIEIGLKRWGHRAYSEALQYRGSVTVLRGNRICRIRKGNKVEVISELPQTKYKITQRSFKLKG